MRPLVTWLTAAWVATIGTAAAQESARPVHPPPGLPPLLAVHDDIADSLARIARRSATWRAEIAALRGTGRHAVIVTSDRVLVAEPDKPGRLQPFDTMVLAEVAPVVVRESEVRTVLVVVNLALLDALHDRRGSLPGERNADLDRILVHEIYGHALPYLRAGNLSGRCPDPVRDERAADACAIARENALGKELGFGRRTDYNVNGLLFSRPIGVVSRTAY
jgi:hypothetical protein